MTWGFFVPDFRPKIDLYKTGIHPRDPFYWALGLWGMVGYRCQIVGGLGRIALYRRKWTTDLPIIGYSQYYKLDDRFGEAEIRSDARFTKYQFDGHGLRRLT